MEFCVQRVWSPAQTLSYKRSLDQLNPTFQNHAFSIRQASDKFCTFLLFHSCLLMMTLIVCLFKSSTSLKLLIADYFSNPD